MEGSGKLFGLHFKGQPDAVLPILSLHIFSVSSRGDLILEVDSVSLRHAALSEAYTTLNECGPGLVSLIISRHPDPKVR